MKFVVSGPVAIATSKGDVEPGDTLDEADLPEYVNLGALLTAGHLAPEKKKAAGSGGSRASS
jgi:hypothetical protein